MTQPLRSTLLVGKVRHRRNQPTEYALRHDVWYFGLRLDELPRVFDLTRLLRRNRWAVVSFRDEDFLPQRARDLPRDIAEHLLAEGFDADGWEIELIANLRVFGYVFNPAAFYLCRDADGFLQAVVVEVHNTYGDRHVYTLRPATPPSAAGDAFSSSMEKTFFVSPFIGPDGRYRVTIRERGTNLDLAIALRDGDQLILATSLVLRRVPLTRANLVRLLVRRPLVTYRTIALIHWHALRLWLRGVPFLHHGARPGLAEDAR
jgi:DUF1365 family protein